MSALIPMAYLIERTTDAGWARSIQILARSDVLVLAARSLALALVVAALSGVLGTITAWLCECSDIAGVMFWHIAVVSAIAVPSYVTAYAWVSSSPTFASFWGAVVVLTGVCTPLIHLQVSAAIRRLDPALEEVAASLGHSSASVSVRIVLPQVRGAVASGMLLAVLYALADFGAVATMRIQVFTWTIHGAYRNSFDPNRAAVLSLVLVAISGLFIAVELRVRRSSRYEIAASGPPRPRIPVRLGRASVLAYALLFGFVGVGTVFPIVRSLQWVLTGQSRVSLSEFSSALLTTASIGAAVAVIGACVAVPVGWLAAQHRSTASVATERSMLVLHSLPGIVLALAFVHVGTRVLLPLYQTWPLAIIGLIVLNVSLAISAVRSSFEQQSPSIVQAAQTLGLTETRTLVRVAGPMAWPAVAAGIASVAIHTAKELPMTLLLRPSGADTLATRVWKWAGVSDDASVGPYALALVVLSVPPTVLLAYRERHRAR